MTKKQIEIIKEAKETLHVLVEKAKDYKPKYHDFENNYAKLMKLLDEFIEDEIDEKLNSTYTWSYNTIKSYGEKAKGAYGVSCDYEKSIKKNASQKSKNILYSSIRKATEHIKYDIDRFFQLIPELNVNENIEETCSKSETI